MFNRLLFLLLVFIFSSECCFCQTQKLDSAFAVYHSMQKIDSPKVKLLVKIINKISETDVDRALQYCDTLIFLVNKKFSPVWVAQSYLFKSKILDEYEKYKEAISNNESALKILGDMPGKQALHTKADIYSNLGYAANSMGNYDKALEYYLISLNIGYKLKDSINLMTCTTNIGSIYEAIEDWESAIKYAIKTIGLTYTKKYGINMCVLSYSQMGHAYLGLKQYTESLRAHNRAIALSDTLHVSADIKIYAQSCITAVYLEMKDYLNAYNASMIVLDFYKDESGALPEEYYTSYLQLGSIFMEAPDNLLKKWNITPEKRFDTVEAILNKMKDYNDQNESKYLHQAILENQAELYERKGDYKKAYSYFKSFRELRDSVGYSNLQKRILIKDLGFDFDRKTDSMKTYQLLSDSRFRQQIFTQQQQALLAEKEKQLQHLAFLKTQADLENTNLENSRNLQQLSLSKKEQQLQDANVRQLASEKQITVTQFKQQRRYVYIGIGFLAFLSTFLFYNNRLRRKRQAAVLAQEKSAQQLKEAELKNRMNDITLSALRSQMNPHFIFNCLNSIKLYTKENNTAEASDYIGKFAKLIRNMLDNSRSDRISLESEIESLKLYIELEAMRFKDKLQYSINVDKDLDISFIDIPPLLVQPYIENAIWHGLMPKKEGGHININISQNTADNLLLISIIDDGIGREASAAINDNKQQYHKSMGTEVTGERIALINEKYQSKANVTITDLYNNNQPAGTQVTIKLPLE